MGMKMRTLLGMLEGLVIHGVFGLWVHDRSTLSSDCRSIKCMLRVQGRNDARAQFMISRMMSAQPYVITVDVKAGDMASKITASCQPDTSAEAEFETIFETMVDILSHAEEILEPSTPLPLSVALRGSSDVAIVKAVKAHGRLTADEWLDVYQKAKQLRSNRLMLLVRQGQAPGLVSRLSR